MGRRTVEQRIKGPANPEILLDILGRSAEPLAGADKHIPSIRRVGRKELGVSGIHYDARLVIRRLADAVAGIVSRRIFCIQSGSVSISAWRSLTMSAP